MKLKLQDKKPKNEAVSGVVVGKDHNLFGGLPKLDWRRPLFGKKAAVIVGACILALIIIAVVLLVLNWPKSHSNNQTHKKQQNNANQIQQYIQTAQAFAAKGDYTDAEQMLEDSLSSTTSVQQKLSVYFMQSSIATDFNKYNDAENYAQKALKFDPNDSSPYISLAYIAKAQGDNKLAANYWQQAISKLNKDDPNYRSKLYEYQSQLAQVETQ